MNACERCGATGVVIVICPNCRAWLCKGCDWAHDCPVAPEASTAVVNVCRHSYLVWACQECKAEAESEQQA